MNCELRYPVAARAMPSLISSVLLAHKPQYVMPVFEIKRSTSFLYVLSDKARVRWERPAGDRRIPLDDSVTQARRTEPEHKETINWKYNNTNN